MTYKNKHHNGVTAANRLVDPDFDRARVENPASWHPTLTIDRIMEYAEAQMFGTQDVGLCIHCGGEREMTEPDAREYDCPDCMRLTVYGAPELLIYVAP